MTRPAPYPDFDDNALCRRTDPEIFFPDKGGSTREAKATCARCQFQRPCLAYALTHTERFGIWGGTSERERRALQQRFGIKPVPVFLPFSPNRSFATNDEEEELT